MLLDPVLLQHVLPGSGRRGSALEPLLLDEEGARVASPQVKSPRGCRNWPLGPHHGRTKAAARCDPMQAALRRHARVNEALKYARTYVSSKPMNSEMV